MNQTEEWLYKKAKEVDSELELQDLYTSKFMFGGSWVMDLLEEYHKEQLILSGVVNWLPFKDENYQEFTKLCANDNLIVRFDDGTECDHKKDYPMAILTHFRKRE